MYRRVLATFAIAIPSGRRLMCVAGLLSLAACGPGGVDAAFPTATLAEFVPTVVEVRWQTAEPSRGFVQFNVVGEPVRETPLEPAATTEHSRTLLGLPVDSEVEFTVLDEAGPLGEPGRVSTGSVPASWASFSTTGEPSWEGFMAFGVAGAMADLMIVDVQGRPVWWWTDGSAEAEVIRAFPSADGTGMYASVGGTVPGEAGTIVLTDWFAGTQRSVAVDDFSHDFVEREDGGLAALTYVHHDDASGKDCLSEAVTEFDFDGASEHVWDAWDSFSGRTATCDSYIEGWTHANALDWDESRQRYTVGLRNLNTIITFDRATGEEVWSVGDFGSIGFVDPAEAFVWQHQFELLDDDRLLVFDNGSSNASASRVVELSVDAEAGVAETVWSHAPEPALYVYALGDVRRLPSGNTLIDWSTAGRVEEVSPEGETVWRLDVEMGAGFGYLAVFGGFW